MHMSYKSIAIALCLMTASAAAAHAAEPAKAFAGFQGWGAGPIEMVLVSKAGPLPGAVPAPSPSVVPESLKGAPEMVADSRR